MPDGKPDLSGFSGQGPLLRTMFESRGRAAFDAGRTKAINYNLNAVRESGRPVPVRWDSPRQHQRRPFEIVQNSNRVAFLYELMSTWRIHPGRRTLHPKRVDPSYFGNGIGSWDGDTWSSIPSDSRIA